MKIDASNTIDLCHPALGTRVVSASDDFFAPKERLILPDEPVYIPGKYDDHGKWMDGWESRRRRDTGHDFCVVRLGRPGVINTVDIDTRHFTGNYPPAAMIEACACDAELPPQNAQWRMLVPASRIIGDSHNLFTITNRDPWTHLRLNIYPDGGVARLRVYGRVAPEPVVTMTPIDLASAANGARPIACSDEHFGRFANILWPGRADSMNEGWETRRRRDPGNDWGLIELAAPGRIEKIIVDTAHFKGNYPDRCSIQAAGASNLPGDALVVQSMFWPVLLPEQKLQMDREHVFEDLAAFHEPIQFLRVNIIPDGGLSRIRVFGVADAE